MAHKIFRAWKLQKKRRKHSKTKLKYANIANLLLLFFPFYLLCSFCWFVLSCQFLCGFLGLSQMANAGVPPDLWLMFPSRVSPRSFLVCPWPFSLSFMPTAEHRKRLHHCESWRLRQTGKLERVPASLQWENAGTPKG